MTALSLNTLLVTLICVGSTAWLWYKRYRELRPALRVEKLFLFPIKGLRPVEDLKEVEVSEKGFKYDRRFVLVSPKEDGAHECHLAASYPSHSQLRQTIDWTALTLTITAPSSRSYTVPLTPSTASLTPFTVNLHQSPVPAFDMGDEAAAFFTEVSEGKETRLMWLDERISGAKYGRKVLGRISDGKDNASYMIASSASLDAFSSALGRPMPIMPLRPNILVGPAGPGEKLKPWVEDFWGELRVGKAIIRLTNNCVRCVSLNIDYETGKRLEGTGLPLQVLSKDRRVDPGAKYSPVFGRYGFSHDVGSTIAVGDPVQVTKINKYRSRFGWPGMGTD
ncbi:hypothetical protein JCM8097_005248 [Rhodosporidiobolus ruineniae]